MVSKIKVGVVGAGHLGRIHLDLLNQSDLYELMGFYDTNKNHSLKIAREFGYKYYNSIDDLIAKCEMIDIVTPTKFHYEIAVKCIEEKKNIFIEKPITHSYQTAKKLNDILKKNQVYGQVGHVERFNPAFLSVKKNINRPMFIESHRLSEFNQRGTDVPVVLDLMIHDIDIILECVKSKVKEVSGVGVAILSKTPDIANARIEFENGSVANLTASRISLKNMRKTRFFQKDAYISIDFLKKKSEIIKIKNSDSKKGELALILKNSEGEKKQIYFDSPSIKKTNAILDELESFALSINNKKEPEVTFDQATEALRIAELIIKSFQ